MSADDVLLRSDDQGNPYRDGQDLCSTSASKSLQEKTGSTYCSRNQQDIISLESFRRLPPSVSPDDKYDEGKNGEDEANGLHAAMVHIVHLDDLLSERFLVCCRTMESVA